MAAGICVDVCGPCPLRGAEEPYVMKSKGHADQVLLFAGTTARELATQSWESWPQHLGEMAPPFTTRSWKLVMGIVEQAPALTGGR